MSSKFLKHHLLTNSCEKPGKPLWHKVAKTSLACISAAVLLAGTGLVSPAQAAGFYIQEQSVQGLGSAFSGSVTNLEDPSTVYFNPAGMTKLKGTQAQAAAHLLIPKAELTDTGSTAVGGGPISGGDGGNPYDPTPVPNGFLTHDLDNDFVVGLGITAPFGLANDYGSDWFGRFDSTETELVTIDIQPSAAWQITDEFSVGVGLNIQYSDAELKNAVHDGTQEGVSTLEGDDWSYGYTVGLQYQPLPSTTFGASYRSAISHQLEGSIQVEGTANANFDVNGQADLDLPDVATFGVSHDVNDKWTLQGQATWFGWNNFQDITAITNEDFSIPLGLSFNVGDTVNSVVQNYQTSWAFAFGAEYMWNEAWTFRGGFQFDETPTTDQYRTSRTPDGDRTWLSLGGSYNVNDRWDIDFAGTYIFIDDETIDVQRNDAFSSLVATQVEADTENQVGIVALSVTYKF